MISTSHCSSQTPPAAMNLPEYFADIGSTSVRRPRGEATISASEAPPEFFVPERARAMLVDDEPINVRIARKYLIEAGFERISECTNPVQAYTDVLEWRPDVLILDIMMPQVSGLEILEQLRNTPATRHLPVIVLTAASDRATRLKALNLGATDFLSKPVDPLELVPRVRNAISLKHYHDHLYNYNRELEEAVNRKTAELELSHREVLHCLARAAEFRDDDTGRHIMRVGRYAAIIAHAMGMEPDYVRMIEQAAQLHDVGKIG
ncbi:MAG: response regulator, partial [Planctomycetaceae bacterium]|nr:response regulator [Planctomycetaceae bacterium]